MEVASGVREEFDKLLDEADRWPSTFNLAAVGGFLVRHPEIVGREELPVTKANREYQQSLNMTAARAAVKEP